VKNRQFTPPEFIAPAVECRSSAAVSTQCLAPENYNDVW